MKFNEKTKKTLTIGGCVVIGAALITAIGLQFPKAPAQTDVLPPTSTESAEVMVVPPETPPTAESTSSPEEKEVVIQPNTTAPESSQAVDSRPAQTDQPEQSIQPEATKPVVTEEQKKDRTQTPNGERLPKNRRWWITIPTRRLTMSPGIPTSRRAGKPTPAGRPISPDSDGWTAPGMWKA